MSSPRAFFLPCLCSIGASVPKRHPSTLYWLVRPNAKGV
jgi:hypothetical protein